MSANDYKSREAAIKALCERSEPCFTKSGEPTFKGDYIGAIASIPAADVMEVKRGKWLTESSNPRTYGRIRAMCGRCGAFALYELINVGSFKEQLSAYCPRCGAKMDGGGE